MHISDEELILRYYAGDDYVNALPDGGKPRIQLDAQQSLLKIVEQIAKQKKTGQVFIKRPEFSLCLGKKQ